MLNILAAAVLTTALAGGAVPKACEPRLAKAREFAALLQPSLKATLIVHVVPPEWAEPDMDMLAWTMPTEPQHAGKVWIRADYLCATSDNALRVILAHEVMHLTNPTLEHEAIYALLERDFGAKAWLEYLNEIAKPALFPRMARWQDAMTEAELHEMVRAVVDQALRGVNLEELLPKRRSAHGRRAGRVPEQGRMAGGTP